MDTFRQLRKRLRDVALSGSDGRLSTGDLAFILDATLTALAEREDKDPERVSLLGSKVGNAQSITAAEQDLRRALERCSIRVPDGLGAMASELALTVERLREDLAERTREHAAALDARSGEAEQEAARLRLELVNARQARATAEKQARIAQGEAERLREIIERKPAPWHGNALCFAGIQGRRYALVEVAELDPDERKRLLADPRRMGGESLDEFRVRLAAQGGG